MADKLELLSQQDAKLKQQLEGVDWPIEYGNIKVQIRAGKATLLVIEKTVKLD